MSARKTEPAVRAAATLPGEYEFLSAIAADLRDEAPRLAYADWLDERGDPRAGFVRDLVAAVRRLRAGGGPLPNPKAVPPVWATMLGLPLLQGAVQFGLVDVVDQVLRLARPILTIETTRAADARLAVGASKFGGRPDLPAGTEWPRCPKGRLGFLGQIDLGEIGRTQAAHALPRSGLLSFFAYQDFNSGYQPGVGDGAAGDTRVLYAPAGESLERRPPPDDLGDEGNGILPACRLTMVETWDLPSIDDRVPRPYAAALKRLQQGDRGEALHEVRRTCHSFGHHLMGYSVHFRTSDPAPGPGWPHLLCLHSDDRLGWSWCDGEHLAVFVRGADLAAGRFARVFGYAS